MSAFLVLERPDHSPRVLGAFSSAQDAENARETLVAAQPNWERFVSVRASQRSRGNDEYTRRSYVATWLVALVVVDVLIAYALYLAASALADLV
jgi:hypothetical protein